MSTTADARKTLIRLAGRPAMPELSEAARVVATHRRLIRKAMKMGHSLDTMARELNLPKRTLQRHMNEAGLFFRKPRVNKGHAVKKNRAALLRAKVVLGSNI